MKRQEVLDRIKGGLIVSCQALEDEPLHSDYIMGRMAFAAYEGGAVGIRANSVKDIKEIKSTVNLPVIGIVKKKYDDSEAYITVTMKEVDALVEVGTEIIATDATRLKRSNGETLETFFGKVRKKYPEQLFMADCSTYEEAVLAEKLGFDFVGTTLRGYTPYTKGIEIPDISLIEKMVKTLDIFVIAEGGIWSPSQLKAVMDTGCYSAVVGTAITRPREITKKYVDAIK